MEQLKQDAAEVLLSLDGTWWTGIALAALFAGGATGRLKRGAAPTQE